MSARRLLLTQQEAAAHANVSTRTFRDWRLQPAHWHGRKPLYRRADVTREAKRRSQQRGSKVRDPASRTRMETARAELVELQLTERRGQLLPVDLVEEQMVAYAVMFTSALDGASARLQRAAPMVQQEIRNEFVALRENLCQSIEAHIKSLEARRKNAARLQSADGQEGSALTGDGR